MQRHLRSHSITTQQPIRAQWLLCLLVFANLASQAEGQVTKVPALGSRVPEQVITARVGDEECLTDVKHRDPCASIKIKNIMVTVAWDEDTKAISYLFTDDHHFVTDSELGVGGSCNVSPKVGEPVPLFSYMDWLVSPRWADTSQDLSGDAVWHAALRKDPTHQRYARIAGFVQSRYLKVGR